MIKKIPGINGWVLNTNDFSILRNTCNTPSMYYILKLPLFSTSLTIENVYISNLKYHNDELCCVIDCKEAIVNNALTTIEFTLEKIEAINKTWNEFYETSTRK